jgi:predicted RNA-binding protein with PUA-like domain
MASRKTKSNYWVWVTSPEYYLDLYGNERSDLDPDNKGSKYQNWTCHRDTKRGDLILLYRSRLNKDVGYLIQATSDAERSTNKSDKEKGWEYFCNCASVYKFQNPLILEDIRSDPYLADWTANRENFQKMVYQISSPDWKRLSSVLAIQNRGYKTFLSNFEGSVLPDPVVLEEEIEDILVNDLSDLRNLVLTLICVVKRKTAITVGK